MFRARDLLVRQRTQIINALRGHLAEFGIVVAKGRLTFRNLCRLSRIGRTNPGDSLDRSSSC